MNRLINGLESIKITLEEFDAQDIKEYTEIIEEVQKILSSKS